LTSGYAIGERYPTSRPHAVCPCGTISAARSPQLLKRICRLVHRNENRRQPCRAASGTKDGARHEADASRAAAPMAMILTKRHPLIMERLAPWGRLHLRVSRATPLRASGARHRGGGGGLAAGRRPQANPKRDTPTPIPPCTIGTCARRSPIFNVFIRFSFFDRRASCALSRFARSFEAKI